MQVEHTQDMQNIDERDIKSSQQVRSDVIQRHQACYGYHLPMTLSKPLSYCEPLEAGWNNSSCEGESYVYGEMLVACVASSKEGGPITPQPKLRPSIPQAEAFGRAYQPKLSRSGASNCLWCEFRLIRPTPQASPFRLNSTHEGVVPSTDPSSEDFIGEARDLLLHMALWWASKSIGVSGM